MLQNELPLGDLTKKFDYQAVCTRVPYNKDRLYRVEGKMNRHGNPIVYGTGISNLEAWKNADIFVRKILSERKTKSPAS